MQDNLLAGMETLFYNPPFPRDGIYIQVTAQKSFLTVPDINPGFIGIPDHRFRGD
jgi:hypothetical protein